MKITLLPLLALSLTTSLARADEPLPPPTTRNVKSPSGRYVALSQIKPAKTTVYKLEKGRKTQLWEMNGWFRNAFLCDDGRHLIAFYDGANLLNLEYRPDDVMMRFYERGKLLRAVRLNQIIAQPTPDKFRRTVSHYAWLESYGLNARHQFEIRTLRQKTLLFDPKTGFPIVAKSARR